MFDSNVVRLETVKWICQNRSIRILFIYYEKADTFSNKKYDSVSNLASNVHIKTCQVFLHL